MVGVVAVVAVFLMNRRFPSPKMGYAVAVCFVAWCGILIQRAGCTKIIDCPVLQYVPADVLVWVCTMCLVVGTQTEKYGILLGVRSLWC